MIIKIIIASIIFVFSFWFGIFCGILSEIRKYDLQLKDKFILSIKILYDMEYLKEFTKPYYLSNSNKIIKRYVDFYSTHNKYRR